MKKRVLVLSLLCIATAAPAQRGALVDPTRPPAVATESGAKEAAAPAGPRLQSVLISPTRRIAVISGSTVGLGEKFGGATVTAISESGVSLRYADRKETLQLIPGVIKRERGVDAETQSHKGNSR